MTKTRRLIFLLLGAWFVALAFGLNAITNSWGSGFNWLDAILLAGTDVAVFLAVVALGLAVVPWGD